MKAKELRAMSVADLEAKAAELKKDLFFLRMQHATNQLDNPIKIALKYHPQSKVSVINKMLDPIRARRHEFEQDIPEVFNILKKGA